MPDIRDKLAGRDSLDGDNLSAREEKPETDKEVALPIGLEQQAEAGDGSAACQLGDLYRIGEVLKQDWAKAFHWYEIGASLGDREAQNNLGTMFLEGIGCQADKAQAVYWYRKSAERGNKDAQ